VAAPPRLWGMQHGKLGRKRPRSMCCPASPIPAGRVCSRCGSMGECKACAARPSFKAPRTSDSRWHRARGKCTLRRLFLPHAFGRPLVDGLLPPRLGCLSQALRWSAPGAFPPSSSSEIASLPGSLLFLGCGLPSYAAHDIPTEKPSSAAHPGPHLKLVLVLTLQGEEGVEVRRRCRGKSGNDRDGTSTIGSKQN
jgi:hypothetical protein